MTATLQRKTRTGGRRVKSKVNCCCSPGNKIFVERHLQSHFQAQCTLKVMRSTCPRLDLLLLLLPPSCSSFYCLRSPFYGLVSGCLPRMRMMLMVLPLWQCFLGAIFEASAGPGASRAMLALLNTCFHLKRRKYVA